MKIALISTTIYVPKVLELYRKIDSEVTFYITGDRKTPHDKTREFISSLGNAFYYSDNDQEKLGYKSSEIIGWNKIMRRNIALLEAIRNKSDVIITIDDDNIPIGNDYFSNFKSYFSSDFNGPMVDTDNHWFNVGEFLEPPVFHRGFPYDQRSNDIGIRIKPICNKKIGVAAGLWLGDPDIDAMQRISNHPMVYKLSEILSNGIIVDNQCMTPFDSQNTAYILKLAPLMMVWAGVGRYDDIWQSYAAQRIMMETDYHVHFGKPFVWQERNTQNLWNNLKDEIFGMEKTPKFCADLLAVELGKGSILDKLFSLYEALSKLDYLPPVVCELGNAWCQDVEDII